MPLSVGGRTEQNRAEKKGKKKKIGETEKLIGIVELRTKPRYESRGTTISLARNLKVP